MSLQFTPNTRIILSAFQQVGLSQGQYYQSDQLFSALDQLTGKLYDRDVAQQLFDQCSPNQRGQIQLEELANIVIEADKILKKKVSQNEQQISQNQAELMECQKQVQQEKYTQQLNQFGIDRDSQLGVLIKQAQGIQFTDFSNSYITITVDHAEQHAQASGGNKLNPDFNQQLLFSIQTGQEEVILSVFVQDRNQRKTLLGQSHIDLSTMRDQQVHHLTQQLINSKGQSITTIVYLEAQWVHNKLKYNEELIKQQEMAISQCYNDIDDYKRDLLTVQEPFLEKDTRNHLQQSLKPSNQQSKSIPQTNAAQFYQQQQGQPQQQQIALPIQPQIKQSANAFHQEEEGELSDEIYFGFILYLLMLILALFQCFARPDYLDLLLAMLYLIIVCRDCLEANFIKIVGVVTVFSIVLDIFWIAIYKHWWSGTDKTLPTWGEAGDPIVRITIVFCIFNIILKTTLCYILFHYYKAALNDQRLKFEFWQFEFHVGYLKQNLFTQKELLK